MEMLIILVLVIALIFVKLENYKTRGIEKEKLRIEVREYLKKELQNIGTGEPHNYFSEAVVIWFKDFKENNRHYILSGISMYNNSSELEKNSTQICSDLYNNKFYFFSSNRYIDEKRNGEMTFADIILLQKCKEFLKKRDELFSKNLNFND